MIETIRKAKFSKPAALTLAFFMLGECLFPGVASALTGGPSQPEVQGFQPVGTSDMVDPFTGDLSYNIPLIDVGGYPINLSYQSGITMDQEASWVGLGWTINPGVVNRSMRGVPDDFNGEEVKREFNMRPNQTYGVTWTPLEGELFGLNVEKLAKLKLSSGIGVTFNSYNGIGLALSVSASTSSMDGNKSPLNANLGLSLGSESGLGVSPSISFSKKIEDENGRDGKVTSKVGLPFNSRAGLTALTLSNSVDKQMMQDNKNADKKNGKPAYVSGATPQGDKYKSTTVSNGGSSISFASPSYTPKLNLPLLNTSLALSLSLGGEVFGAHPNMRFDGHYSSQFLLSKTKSVPAYGYLNMQNGQNLLDVMMDFNREKDGSFTENTPALPLANLTYDVYSVSGQGIGGMYRPHRSEIGYVFDNMVNNYSTALDLPAIELGLGNAAHPGTNFSANFSITTTGKWEEDNLALALLRFRNKTFDRSYPGYEPYYFRQAGEKTVDSDPSFFQKQGGFDPVKVAIYDKISTTPALPYFEKDDGGQVAMAADNYRKKRVRRNEAIAFLNNKEATAGGVAKRIEVYDHRSTGYTVSQSIPYPFRYKPRVQLARSSAERKDHHISEISTYRADGARYVYGIAAYNYTQHDVTFAIMGGDPDCATGLVSYNHGADNTVKNNKGIDEYYERTIMPAYAHSYLLTAILSADYVDVKNDGLTDDDLGTYTRINYGRSLKNDNASPTDPANYLYQWRVPFEKGKANYNEGLKSIGNNETYGDDKASYVYGKKELWYIHSIETKTHVAEFYISDRKDGYGADSEEGGIGANSIRMKKLDRIVLYAKEDRVKNGEAAIPIKTVHFEYDYSLCKGIDNNIDNQHIAPAERTAGKLTLKKVYFTYGTSHKASLSPYEFTYGQVFDNENHAVGAPVNPAYNLKGYDRWGNFKDNSGAGSCSDINAPLNTSEFPYTDQDKMTFDGNPMYKADVYAVSWTLTSVKLPSGGEINVALEADDYAYVQNRRAMQMVKVKGVAESNVNDATVTDFIHNNDWKYVVFELPPGDVINTHEDVYRRCFSEKDGTPMTDLYFRFFMNLKFGNYEYVSGYRAPVFNDGKLSCGIMSIGGVKHGWVELKKVYRGLSTFNPISYASWDYMKRYLPRLAYNQPTMNDNGILQTVKALGAMFTSISQMVTGYYTSMSISGNGSKFIPGKSFIRVYAPLYTKKGGGVRVKRITLNDKWASLLDDDTHYSDFRYGQEYTYTTKDEYGHTISSGVAAYEPMLGGEENPFRQPVPYEEEKFLAPDEEYYQETPYGESYFPSPSVGYSKVMIRNINPDHSGVRGTGYTVKEFYTARDFPTITRQTGLDVARFKPDAILKLLKIRSQDHMAATQGFVVELNDMHGKPKAEAVYAENKTEPITGVEYKYRQSTPNRLDNTMLTMAKDKTIGTNMVGVECDMTVDFRQSKTDNYSGGLGGNLDAFLAFVLPVAIPVVLPSYAYEGVSFKSASVTKVINRYGILESTVAYDLGSRVHTTNKMLDEETGEVLLTETVNEFNDNVYNFTFPSHWAYDAMGPAYKNLGYEQNAPINLAARVNNEDLFVPGDEVLYTYVNSLNEEQSSIANVILNNGAKRLVQKGGYPVNINTVRYIKVIRSGRRNQANAPVGSVVTLRDPLHLNAQQKYELLFDQVINASATEYGEGWPFFCECELQPGRVYNPYTVAFSGIWRQKRTWAFLTNRTQSRLNDNTNIRKDGVFESFTPFWVNPDGSSWSPATDGRWQFVNQVTLYSPQGFEIENVDPLGRYSAAQYGYKDMLPVAVAVNSRYRDIGFDGFEDYSYVRCEDDHFSYKQPVLAHDYLKISGKHSHSGRRSLRITPGYHAVMNKKITIKTNGCVEPSPVIICPPVTP